MENTITFVMLEHHKNINKLLDKLMDGFGADKVRLFEDWEYFKLKIESHMHAEERAIFSFESIGDVESQKTVRELLLDHRKIREIIQSIDTDFDVNFGVNIIDLQRLLLIHENVENNVLYPRLDKLTNEEEKVQILSKIE